MVALPWFSQGHRPPILGDFQTWRVPTSGDTSLCRDGLSGSAGRPSAHPNPRAQPVSPPAPSHLPPSAHKSRGRSAPGTHPVWDEEGPCWGVPPEPAGVPGCSPLHGPGARGAELREPGWSPGLPGETNPARREARPGQECPRAGFPGRKSPGKVLGIPGWGVRVSPRGRAVSPTL